MSVTLSYTCQTVGCEIHDIITIVKNKIQTTTELKCPNCSTLLDPSILKNIQKLDVAEDECFKSMNTKSVKSITIRETFRPA